MKVFSALNFVVAIPTYKRYEQLKTHTLSLLKRIHLDMNKVYIFVADEEEKEKYLESLEGENYYKIVVGEKGMMNIRNFICKLWLDGHMLMRIKDAKKTSYDIYKYFRAPSQKD